MEGVVLYVVLVRVFVKHPKQYMMCFTLLSYGLLILFIYLSIIMKIISYFWSIYMLIIVPIGYLVGTDENHTQYLLYENKELVA